MNKYKLIADFLDEDIDTIKSNIDEVKLSVRDAMKLMDKYHTEMMQQYDGVINNGVYIPMKQKDNIWIEKNK